MRANNKISGDKF